jgi:hypothetical protein
VQVDEHRYSLEFLLLLFDHFLEIIDFREGILPRLMIGPIQILPKKARPIIPSHNPIRIDHGHHLKDHLPAQLPSLLLVTTQKPNKPFSHVRGIGLAGVDSGAEDYELFAVQVEGARGGAAFGVLGDG